MIEIDSYEQEWIIATAEALRAIRKATGYTAHVPGGLSSRATVSISILADLLVDIRMVTDRKLTFREDNSPEKLERVRTATRQLQSDCFPMGLRLRRSITARLSRALRRA